MELSVASLRQINAQSRAQRKQPLSPKCLEKKRKNDHKPRGSIYTTIRELGTKIPDYNLGSQFPNGCIYGPSGKHG